MKSKKELSSFNAPNTQLHNKKKNYPLSHNEQCLNVLGLDSYSQAHFVI